MPKKPSKPIRPKLPRGRPPIYSNPEDLEHKMQEYFSGGYRTKLVEIKDKSGKVIDVKEIPMITLIDLVLYLGFADKSTFYDYEKKPGFTHSIKKARSFIEREYEEMLRTNPTGAIFALKNFNWKDKHEVEQHSTVKIDVENMPTEELVQELQKTIGKN